MLNFLLLLLKWPVLVEKRIFTSCADIADSSCEVKDTVIHKIPDNSFWYLAILFIYIEVGFIYDGVGIFN